MKARLMVMAGVAAIALAACSSGSSGTPAASGSTGTGASASTSAGNPALAAAAAAVKAAEIPPTDVGVSVALSRKPDTGKRVTYLTCGVGVCKQIQDQLTVAVKSLGWTLTAVAQGTTPEEIVAAWNRALSANPKPDAIFTSGVPVVVYQAQLDQAKAAGIPVVDWASANPPGTPGIIADINPVTDNEKRGELLADYAAVNSNGAAHVLFLDVPDFKTLVAEEAKFKSTLNGICASTCSMDTLNFAATDIGTKVPSAVVSYLQSHSDVNWVVPAWDDLGLGVPEALKAAGLDSKVKIISQSSSQVAATNIKNGVVEVATIPQGVGQMAYKALDVLARQFNGDPLDADTANLLPIWIQTKDTIGDPNNVWAGPEGYQDAFLKLWKIS